MKCGTSERRQYSMSLVENEWCTAFTENGERMAPFVEKNEGRSMVPAEKRMAYNGSRQKSR